MKKGTVVCVDDERSVLLSLRDQLTRLLGEDYDIELAESAEEALEIFATLQACQSAIPLVISDQIMPRMKGDELLARIHSQAPDTCTILLSGQATLEGLARAVNHANLYRFIAKPWSEEDLETIVQQAIQTYLATQQTQPIYELNLTYQPALQEFQRLKGFLSDAPLEFWEWDVASNYPNDTSNIQAFAELTLLQKQIHPDDRAQVIRCVQTVLAQHKPCEVEYRIQQPNHEIHWFYSWVMVIVIDQQPIKLIGTNFDITSFKDQEAALQEMLKVQARLMLESHHRIKNNLQLVSGLLLLPAQSIQDPKILALLSDTRQRIQAIAQIHERLYQDSDLLETVGVNMNLYLLGLLNDLHSLCLGGKVSIDLKAEVAPIKLDAKISLACGLLMNELVLNAIKHAFLGRESGEILVKFSFHDSGHYCLQVCDNGIGTPIDLNLQKNSSFGLRLVHSLVQQLKGTIVIDRDQGSIFTITFPAITPPQ